MEGIQQNMLGKVKFETHANPTCSKTVVGPCELANKYW
jgi:hypothetical protein